MNKKKTPGGKKFNLPATDARVVAFQVLGAFRQGRFPDEALEKLGARLDRRDRALASALVHGVLRHKTRLEWMIGRHLSKPGKKLDPDVLTILCLGAFQLTDLTRIPARAAVDESVNLAKAFCPPWAGGLVNAVLRQAAREEKPADPWAENLGEDEKLALVFSHPLWLVRRWLEELGPEETSRLLAANNEQPPLTIRTNTPRTDRNALADLLTGRAAEIEETPFSPAGLRLCGSAGAVADLPGFSEGFFAVQDEAAQVIGFLAKPRPGEKVLDACAGRGGKSFHLAAQNPQGTVIGLDVDFSRLAQTRAEQNRLGLGNLCFVQGDLAENAPFPEKYFDLVLVDAPCSNLGVIRRRPDVKWSKSPDEPARKAAIQKKLLTAASRLVKPGGRLVYAVCTLTPEETLGVTDDFWMNNLEFGLKPVSLYLPEQALPLACPDGVLRAWPHRSRTDGFFAAVFERKPQKPPDFK
ncbi:MAG: 16S rRNA (cytosine(967)-C(5))-methyltransferase RsmB [Pseudomonadota bacterium]